MGDRQVQVVSAGSGHSDWDMCYLDSHTGLLFVGDILYPGYLYIRRYREYCRGIKALHRCVATRFTWIMGAHVEMRRDGELYPSGARYQPDEHALQLGPHVLETLVTVLSKPQAPINRDFALTPHSNL